MNRKNTGRLVGMVLWGLIGFSLQGHAVQPEPGLSLQQLMAQSWRVVSSSHMPFMPWTCDATQVIYTRHPKEKGNLQATFVVCPARNPDGSCKGEETAQYRIRRDESTSANGWWEGTWIEGKMQMDPNKFAPWVGHWVVWKSTQMNGTVPAYIAIGGPNGKKVFIYTSLSTRTPRKTYEDILSALRAKGFLPSDLIECTQFLESASAAPAMPK